MPSIRGLRYRLSEGLKNAAASIYSIPGGEILNIGAELLGSRAKHALVVYTIQAIPYYVAGDLGKCPIINEHTMYWESAEMVRQLNEAGYVVDYYDVHSKTSINWDLYDLVIDERDNLVNIPSSRRADLVKISYCTGNQWLFHNLAELNRIHDFHRRHGIYVSPERQIAPYYSDEAADYMTHFGAPFQLKLFSSRPQMHLLNISAVCEPEYKTKDMATARRNFLWLGSGGLLLKGLDLVVEAFAQTPDLHLYIGGHASREKRFWSWLKPMLDRHANLHYLGWVDVGSASFAEIAHSCVGTIYVSSTEGGAGSVAQLSHFGLIPVVTESAAVRVGEALGTVIRSQEPDEIVSHIIRAVQELTGQSDAELQDRCAAVYEFGRKYHTRNAYSRTFQELLTKVL